MYMELSLHRGVSVTLFLKTSSFKNQYVPSNMHPEDISRKLCGTSLSYWLFLSPTTSFFHNFPDYATIHLEAKLFFQVCLSRLNASETT